MKRFVRSVSFAGKGLAKAWRDEANFRIEVVVAIVVIVVSYLLGMSELGLAIIILTCALVLGLELINTMIELVSDVLKPRLDQSVRIIKDLVAAAVAISALGAIGVAICLLWPLIARLLWR